jgi:formate/nitrite transporter FocA (FNT family)
VIWRPDAVGSILFLVSSAIALSPEVRAHRHSHVRDRSWTIAVLNMLGSIFFGVSAVGAYVVPDTQELLNSAWSNSGTLLGALCFLVGALLVLPRSAAP